MKLIQTTNCQAPKVDPDAAITARATEATKELFDEDIVRPELEFDEASFNLFAGLIAHHLCAVRDDTREECAQIVDARAATYERYDFGADDLRELATAIRSRAGGGGAG